MEQISYLIKTLRLQVDDTSYSLAAGTTDTLTSESVDTQGFTGARFILGVGAVTANAVTTFKVAQCDTAAGSYADLLGSSISIADDDDNQIVISDIFKPRERFLKGITTRATANAVIDFLLVELYGPKDIPVATDAMTSSVECKVSPAEGTA